VTARAVFTRYDYSSRMRRTPHRPDHATVNGEMPPRAESHIHTPPARSISARGVTTLSPRRGEGARGPHPAQIGHVHVGSTYAYRHMHNRPYMPTYVHICRKYTRGAAARGARGSLLLGLGWPLESSFVKPRTPELCAASALQSSSQVKPCQVKSSHVKSSQAMPSQVKPCQVKSSHVKSSQAMSSQAKPRQI